MIAPCAGKWELFDSTHPVDHLEAREYCLRCPLLEKCRTELEAATRDAYSADYGPCGTWAGQVVGRSVRSASRVGEEEAAFDTATALAAHAVWERTPPEQRDDLPDEIRVGERVYQRRRKSSQRRRAAS